MTLLMMFPHMWEVQDVPRLVQSHRQEIAGLIAEWDVADVEFGEVEEVLREIQILEAGIDTKSILKLIEKYPISVPIFVALVLLTIIWIFVYTRKEDQETPIANRINNWVNIMSRRWFHMFFLGLVLTAIWWVWLWYDRKWFIESLDKIPFESMDMTIVWGAVVISYMLFGKRVVRVIFLSTFLSVLWLTDRLQLRSPVTSPKMLELFQDSDRWEVNDLDETKNRNPDDVVYDIIEDIHQTGYHDASKSQQSRLERLSKIEISQYIDEENGIVLKKQVWDDDIEMSIHYDSIDYIAKKKNERWIVSESLYTKKDFNRFATWFESIEEE